MNLLLLSLVTAGWFAPTAVPNDVGQNDGKETPPARSAPAKDVFLVVDGSTGRSGQIASEVEGWVRSALGPALPVRKGTFDVEAPEPADTKPENGDTRIAAPPRTAMLDVLSISLEEAARREGPHAVVIIAHEQFYPTQLATDRIVSSAQRLQIPVHTIYLSIGEAGMLHRFGRALLSGAVFIFESLMEDGERSYSAHETGAMLKRMSNSTGGEACVVRDREAGMRCAHMIAQRIIDMNVNSKPGPR